MANILCSSESLSFNQNPVHEIDEARISTRKKTLASAALPSCPRLVETLEKPVIRKVGDSGMRCEDCPKVNLSPPSKSDCPNFVEQGPDCSRNDDTLDRAFADLRRACGIDE